MSLRLREVVEYVDACLGEAVRNTEGLQFAVANAQREVAKDPGVAPLREELERCLTQTSATSKSKIDASARDELDQLVRRVESEYCDNWHDAAAQTPVEFTARAFAAHLLDLGYSSDHLFRWITAVGPGLTSTQELATAAKDMISGMQMRSYEVFVPCAAPYDKPDNPAELVRWLKGDDAAEWLRNMVPAREHRRHAGGFLLRLDGRDPWSAVEAARVIIARAEARAKVSRPSNDSIHLKGWARIAHDERDYEIRPRPRQVEIGSLFLERAVYQFDGGLPSTTDDALELASYMESPSAGAAVTGGWAAIEALLIRPGESNHHTAADRLAALVACSLPRAELTPLAYRHIENGSGDSLARSLQATDTNYQKVRLVEEHLRSGLRLALAAGSDVAAQDRILAIITNPAGKLRRIHEYVTESLRRLYNQRNTVAHSGSLRSAALGASIRTSLTLVGAGLDRIVHAQLKAGEQLAPLSLVARAETELRLVGGPGGRTLSSLLS